MRAKGCVCVYMNKDHPLLHCSDLFDRLIPSQMSFCVCVLLCTLSCRNKDLVKHYANDIDCLVKAQSPDNQHVRVLRCIHQLHDERGSERSKADQGSFRGGCSGALQRLADNCFLADTAKLAAIVSLSEMLKLSEHDSERGQQKSTAKMIGGSNANSFAQTNFILTVVAIERQDYQDCLSNSECSFSASK